MWVDVFRYSVNPEVFLDEGNIRKLLSTSKFEEASFCSIVKNFNTLSDLDSVLGRLLEKKQEFEKEWSDLNNESTNTFSRNVFNKTVMEQSSPLVSSLGVWLQGLSAPCVFEDEMHLKILSLLADDIGVGYACNGRKDKFCHIGKALGLPNYTTSSSELVVGHHIEDDMYCLPALLFALSRRSDAFGPELSGIDFAFRSLGVLPAWQTLAKAYPALDWGVIDLSLRQTTIFSSPNSPLLTSRWIMEQYAVSERYIKRIYDGISWVINGLELWNNALVRQVKIALTPQLAMAKLLKERAREASAYHKNYLLEGKALSIWFQEATKDPFPLLEAISKSKLVSPKKPESSPLISTLLRINQSMFRIFNELDIAIIQRWIESLNTQSSIAEKKQQNLLCSDSRASFSAVKGDSTLGETPNNIREAYYLLQGRALAPRMRDFATDYIDRWLGFSRKSIGKSDRSLPDFYIPGQLREWLLDSHDKNAIRAQKQKNIDIPSREAVINQTLQLAPMTLIDGAWLQGFTDVNLATQYFGAPLFQIYWDELGNGNKSINHPKIYRDVLKAMDIDLPLTGSLDFAYDSRFDNMSFRLPVYWLCLGKLPLTYCLEILGMNLAMELSGVGGGYVSAHRFLKNYKFPTMFVDIHNTIDNVSTGHSAWSADAIEKYMQQVSQHMDPNEAWQRIRTGYESLEPIVKDDKDLNYFKSKISPTLSTNNVAIYHHKSMSDLHLIME